MLLKQQINILKFSGDYFYINETSIIQYNTKYKNIETKLGINSKKDSLINILNLNNESQIYPFINSFKGWQSILLETNFNYVERNIINSAIKNLYLNISGIYELNTLMPNDKFYQNFGGVTKYDLDFYNDKEKFLKIKDDTMQISRIINKCISNPVMRDPFKEFLKEFKYDKGINNVYSLAKLDDGIICPNDPLDLKKIFKTCEKMSETFNSIVGNFKFDEKEINRIFNSAKLFKSIHLSAGFSISKKLKEAVRSTKNLEFDGNPLRVDIVNGEVVFGSSDTGIPEGYIVQVNNYEEGRLLKEHNVSSTNRLLFL